jgi:hypothetical protein
MDMRDCPAGWDEDAHRAWSGRSRAQALETLARRLNAAASEEPAGLLEQFAFYCHLVGDVRAALRAMDRLLVRFPVTAERLKNRAVLRGRLGRHEEAVADLEAALRLAPEFPEIHDGLCAAHYRLGHLDEARKAGTRSLSLKLAAAASHGDGDRAPPPPPNERGKDVIAFSLWGASPRYLRGTLRNALLVPDLYPGWSMRVYHDASVPAPFLEVLARLGVDCQSMDGSVETGRKLMWRFLVAGDPSVRRFLVRDADSVVSPREVRAVTEWIASGRPFHAMRDWWTHTDIVLAGLWGGVAGVLPRMDEAIASYAPSKLTANIDQLFLREAVWPVIATHTLAHDRFFTPPGATSFPETAHPDPTFHVGQDEFAVRRHLQDTVLGPWLAALPCLRIVERAR